MIHDLPTCKPPSLIWKQWHALSQVQRSNLSRQYYAALKPAALTLLAIKHANDPQEAQRLLLGGPLRVSTAPRQSLT